MTSSSLQNLNDNLEKPVTCDWFRPTLMIGGSDPFDEDKWEYIKIGENVIMRSVKPCER